MRNTTYFKAAAITAVLVLAGCVDSPSAPQSQAEDDLLAVSFDGMSTEQAQKGDAERSQEFAWAALALRLGVTPSRLEVRNNGKRELYDAFVHAVTWTVPTAAIRPLTHRTLVAWRKSVDSLQVIMMSLPMDQAPVQNPLSLTPVAGTTLAPFIGAHASYQLRTTKTNGFWLATNGTVKVAEASVGAACARPPVTSASVAAPVGIQCQQAIYTVGFDVGFQPTLADSRTLDTRGVVFRISALDQRINGAKLTFACVLPASDKGCR